MDHQSEKSSVQNNFPESEKSSVQRERPMLCDRHDGMDDAASSPRVTTDDVRTGLPADDEDGSPFYIGFPEPGSSKYRLKFRSQATYSTPPSVSTEAPTILFRSQESTLTASVSTSVSSENLTSTTSSENRETRMTPPEQQLNFFAADEAICLEALKRSHEEAMRNFHLYSSRSGATATSSTENRETMTRAPEQEVNSLVEDEAKCSEELKRAHAEAMRDFIDAREGLQIEEAPRYHPVLDETVAWAFPFLFSPIGVHDPVLHRVGESQTTRSCCSLSSARSCL